MFISSNALDGLVCGLNIDSGKKEAWIVIISEQSFKYGNPLSSP